MEEKRKYPRLNFNVAVEWEKANFASDNKQIHTDTTKNISVGGICLIVDETVKTGDSLRLSIKLPTEKVINSKGVVRWVEDFGIVGVKSETNCEAGVEFTEISDEDQKEIEKFVLSRFGKD